jgi:hypothetical protein
MRSRDQHRRDCPRRNRTEVLDTPLRWGVALALCGWVVFDANFESPNDRFIQYPLLGATGGQEGSAGDLPAPGERSGGGKCKPRLAGNCNRGRCYGSFGRRPEQHW